MKNEKRYEAPVADVVVFGQGDIAWGDLAQGESTVDTGNGIKVPIEDGDLEDGEEIA